MRDSSSYKLIQYHSSTLNAKPLASDVCVGELPINNNSQNPMIMTKDTSGNIRYIPFVDNDGNWPIPTKFANAIGDASNNYTYEELNEKLQGNYMPLEGSTGLNNFEVGVNIGSGKVGVSLGNFNSGDQNFEGAVSTYNSGDIQIIKTFGKSYVGVDSFTTGISTVGINSSTGEFFQDAVMFDEDNNLGVGVGVMSQKGQGSLMIKPPKALFEMGSCKIEMDTSNGYIDIAVNGYDYINIRNNHMSFNVASQTYVLGDYSSQPFVKILADRQWVINQGYSKTNGTVTSVGINLPTSVFTNGSNITTSGTLTSTFKTQSANTVFAGPTSGTSAAPTFRKLVATDIPDLSSVYLPVDGNIGWDNVTKKPTIVNRYITINGINYNFWSDRTTDVPDIFVPTTWGSSGQILQSNGTSNAPTWINKSTLTILLITAVLSILREKDHTTRNGQPIHDPLSDELVI